MSRSRWSAAAASLVAILLLATGCTSTKWNAEKPMWVIATTNFTETNLISQMYLQVLLAGGFDAEIKQLSTREVIVPALEAGEVQITPEYLGSLTEYLNKSINGPSAPQIATGDEAATFAAAQGLAAQRNLTLLTPSPAQDQNAFAVTRELAAANRLVTMSDLAAYSQNNPVILGGPPECPQRPFCEPGLETVYGMKIAEFLPLDAGGPLTVQALNQGKITTGLVFSSSGSISGNDLVVLEDDKNLQTAENLTPALFTPAVQPDVTKLLDDVSAALTTDELRQLNEQVEIYRKNPRLVAQDFLQSKGLLPPS